MAEVVLKEITRDIWPECMNLVLRLEQGGLAAPNSFRMPELKAEPSFMQLAVFHEDEIVGYAMYGLDPDDGKYWVYRLMIDERRQRRGFGKAALAAIIKRLEELPDCEEVFVGYRPDNNIAGALYHRFGFRRTGQMLCGEYIARLDLKNGHRGGQV